MAAARSEPSLKPKSILNPLIADYDPKVFEQNFINMAYGLFDSVSLMTFKDNRGQVTEISDYPDEVNFPVGLRIIHHTDPEAAEEDISITHLILLKPDNSDTFGIGWKLVERNVQPQRIEFLRVPKTTPSVYESSILAMQENEERTNSINTFIKYIKTLVAPLMSAYVNRVEQRLAAMEARVAQQRQQDPNIPNGKWISYNKRRWRINLEKIQFIGEWGVTGPSWINYSPYTDFGDRFRNISIQKICVQWDRLLLYTLVGVAIRTNEGMRYMKVNPFMIQRRETREEREERRKREAADQQAVAVDGDEDVFMGDAFGVNNVTLRL